MTLLPWKLVNINNNVWNNKRINNSKLNTATLPSAGTGQRSTTPVGSDTPELGDEPSTPVAATRKMVTPVTARRKMVCIQAPKTVFPCLYHISSERGAHVWGEDGSLQCTVPSGVALLCMELQWKSYNGWSSMMLRMPDGWVQEDALEWLNSVRLPITPFLEKKKKVMAIH